MSTSSGLSQNSIIAFVPIVDVARAKVFYGQTLGLRLLEEELPFALVFDANGIMLRLTLMAERTSNQGSVLGWKVPDIVRSARALQEAGVVFERYPYMEQDDQGIWTTPTGARVAWFKDPDGNVLSISQHPDSKPEGS
jgi:predicted enzyme related to lactoylglutathione lyase